MVDRLNGTRALPRLATPALPAAEAAPAAPAPAERRTAGDQLSLRGRDPLAAGGPVDLERIDVSVGTIDDAHGRIDAAIAELDAQAARLVGASKNPAISRLILKYVDGIRDMLIGINQVNDEKKDEKLKEAHRQLKKLMEAAIASGDLTLLVALRTLLKAVIGKMAITDPQVADFKQLDAEVLRAIEAIREKTGLLKLHQDTWRQTVARSSAAEGGAPSV